MSYETQTQTDIDLGQQVVHGVLSWYYWGSQACESLNSDSSATPLGIVQGIVSEAGYDFTGAEAIVAGAVRNLCPQLEDGYTTSMDKQVQTTTDSLDEALGGVDLPVMQVGAFAKLVCQYFEDSKGDQLMSYLETHAILPEPQDNSVTYDDQTTKKAVATAATGFCPGVGIPPGWLV